ncbi:bifunctional nicotinamidase/pyrazinamidase [Legionella israelensis]|uniref:bifunctional nicotinamidase/pyrazinamidase n=1 Tax=Legionella israelensis TaxID=454 RepID=UPI001180363E|nr:bifunctional nicotinamidase/pyrazinamidase [Legionella israelensis]QDP72580.1 bifunctional nicotinamidase/pyrazinamidase [Legionella israelensis]
MKTLVIIDVQNDFMPGGALEVQDGDAIVPVINRISSSFELVIATQDWHPANHKSFASNHADHKPFDKIKLHGVEQILWPDHCVQMSSGAEFHPQLNIAPIETIFRKGTNPEMDSYSGFYDNGHQKSTGLSGYLREKKANELYFCGLAADICVYYSIKDAMKEHFKCWLLEDAVRPLDVEQYKHLKNELVNEGVNITSSSILKKKTGFSS